MQLWVEEVAGIHSLTCECGNSMTVLYCANKLDLYDRITNYFRGKKMQSNCSRHHIFISSFTSLLLKTMCQDFTLRFPEPAQPISTFRNPFGTLDPYARAFSNMAAFLPFNNEQLVSWLSFRAATNDYFHYVIFFLRVIGLLFSQDNISELKVMLSDCLSN